MSVKKRILCFFENTYFKVNRPEQIGQKFTYKKIYIQKKKKKKKKKKIGLENFQISENINIKIYIYNK